MTQATQESTTSSLLQNVEIEREADGRATLRITVAPEAVRAARAAAIRDFGKRLRVPGFRPGHIPANIVRRNVGDEAIAQQVSDNLVPQAYQAALEDSGLQPLERASVDDLTFDAFEGESPLSFVARVVIRPEVELGELTGLAIEHPSVDISDEEIDNGVQALRDERATLGDIEGRGAQEGDVVAAELRVFVDGEQHGEMTRLRPFLLGQSGFTPNIDEHLTGAALDEERRFPVTYPEDFQDEALRGKEAEFAVKVTALKERLVPELNEEFAQQAGVSSLEELRTRMGQFLRANKIREARDEMRAQLAQNVTEASKFDAPQAVIEARYEQRFAQMQQELSGRGATFENYLTESELTEEEFQTRGRAEIEEELRRELVLDEIARREDFAVSGDELEQYYLRMAQVLNRPIEELVREVDVQSVRASILQRKAVDYLLENAVIENAPADSSDSAGMIDENGEYILGDEEIALDVTDAGTDESETGEAEATSETTATDSATDEVPTSETTEAALSAEDISAEAPDAEAPAADKPGQGT